MSRLKEPSTWAGVSGAAAALAGAPLALLVPVQPWLALLSALAGAAFRAGWRSRHVSARATIRRRLAGSTRAREREIATFTHGVKV